MSENSIITLQDKDFVPYLSAEDISAKIEKLAEIINQDYADKQPIILCILSGSFIFTADLVRELSIPHRIEFVRYSSYSGTSSTGQISKILGLRTDIKDQDIIIVEDIIDTGFTISTAIRELYISEPKSIKVASLLFKPDALKHEVPLDYIGFEIPNKFVVGYGLDYNELGRDIPSIYRLKD
ncbi:MAG: hypoxanthine phosphoribosyltransferase [Saprospiraceae bacterium]|jgi:hypoxanthine phosphoribosyltransferase